MYLSFFGIRLTTNVMFVGCGGGGGRILYTPKNHSPISKTEDFNSNHKNKRENAPIFYIFKFAMYVNFSWLIYK